MARERHGASGGTELGRFLRARRTRVTPEEAGLPPGAGLRRTPGLRREELATLAGISIDYYARLERGTETNPSPSVVDTLARALRLDEAEHRHLRALALGADRPVHAPAAVPDQILPEGIELLLATMRPSPAYVVGRTFDVLATNPGGLRLFAGLDEWPPEQRNLARYVCLHPAARELFGDWSRPLHSAVAWLRGHLGVEPDAEDLRAIVDELQRKCPEFADLWGRYDVAGDTHGRHLYHHPDVGDLTLGFHGMTLAGARTQHLVAFFSEPGTPDHDAMVLLDRIAQERYGKPSASASTVS